MNKKLMAVAVAGVLAAPAVALAQASTVQIYGVLNVEYGYSGQLDHPGGGRQSVDSFNSGASRIGFRGTEKLGGGMSAWFQCETDAGRLWHPTGAVTGATQGFCDRNSALGLQGAFGNVFFGTWDSPMKQAVGAVRIFEETGWRGAQHLLINSSGGTTGYGFSTRVRKSVNYNTPNLGGFVGKIQYTTLTNGGSSGLPGAGAALAPAGGVPGAEVDGRAWSMSGEFGSGPIFVNAAYSRHSDNASVAGALGTRDTAWMIGGMYTMGQWRVAAMYTKSKLEPTAATDVSRGAWNLAVNYHISGPHTLRGGATIARDEKGSAAPAGNTGAIQWQIGYQHALSKRTNLGLTYVHLDNKAQGVYNFTGMPNTGGVRAGDGAGAFVLNFDHRF